MNVDIPVNSNAHTSIPRSDILPHESTSALFDQDALPPSRRATVEDVMDEDAPRYAEPFPSELAAGATYGTAKTSFDIIRDDQVLHGADVWGPFRDDEEWELAKWLIKNVGHNQAAEFLKLGLVSISN